MNFLLDTNAVSEWVKPRPNPGVIRWMESVDEDRTFLSVVTLAELHHGVERLPAGARRVRLERWLQHELPLRFEGRILPVDADIAAAWGRTVARCESAGHPIAVIDAFLAATADIHELTLVTRNARHFPSSLPVANPWV